MPNSRLDNISESVSDVSTPKTKPRFDNPQDYEFDEMLRSWDKEAQSNKTRDRYLPNGKRLDRSKLRDHEDPVKGALPDYGRGRVKKKDNFFEELEEPRTSYSISPKQAEGLSLKNHSALNAEGKVDKDWLKRQQDNVEMKTLKDGTEIPYYKTAQTGSLNKQARVPTNVLKKLRGINDEQNNIRKESLDKIKAYMKKNGDAPSKEESIDIFVDQNGTGWILDGNHRIKAASDLGKDSLDVEVRYWNGGELVKNGDFSLDNLLKYGN